MNEKRWEAVMLLMLIFFTLSTAAWLFTGRSVWAGEMGPNDFRPFALVMIHLVGMVIPSIYFLFKGC